MSVMRPEEQFASNLREERKRRGLSQEALGYKSGLHRTEISLLERAGRDPRLSTITKVARALDMKPTDLLKGLE
jgi:transcriptional regulator with XRE-family HTH domain